MYESKGKISERWAKRIETVKLCVGPIIGLAMTVLGV